MSSGQKNVNINTLERAVTTDINDMQTFIASDRNQTFRREFQHPSFGQMTIESGGSSVDTDLSVLPSGDNGTVHNCIGGLMVRPDNSGYLLVDAGSAAFYVPAFTGATAFDSPYIVVDSIGVTLATDLLFTPNAGAGPRCDWIECRPVLATTQQSRDIFDATTQTFTSNLVDKITVAELEFRVRTGVADEGFAALDQEWMPLACVVVQVGATGFNNCDVYDVRPLIEGRTNAYATDYVAVDDPGSPHEGFHLLECSVAPGNSKDHASGWALGEFRGNSVGGQVWKNTPSQLGNFGSEDDSDFECNDTDNQIVFASQAPVDTTGHLNVIVALYPRGLRRWVRYSQNSISPVPGQVAQNPISGRLPRGFNGILSFGRQSTSSQRGTVLFSGDVGTLPPGFGTGPHDTNMGWIVGWARGISGDYFVSTHAGKRVMMGSLALALNPFQLTIGTLPASAVPLTGSISLSGLCPDMAVSKSTAPMQAAVVHLTTNITVTMTGQGVIEAKGPYVKPPGGFNWATGGAHDQLYNPTVAGTQAFTTNASVAAPSAALANAGGKASISIQVDLTATLDTFDTVLNSSCTIVGWDRY